MQLTTKGGEDTNPHQPSEPSPEKGENRAQNGASEGSEGSEDIFRTKRVGPTSSLSEEEKAELRAKYDAARKGINRRGA